MVLFEKYHHQTKLIVMNKTTFLKHILTPLSLNYCCTESYNLFSANYYNSKASQ